MTERPSLVVPRHYVHVEADLLALLREAGFRVHQAFRLSEARSTRRAWSCPHHGQGRCTCEWCTYLVYDDKRRLVATLTLYGHEERTRVTCKCAPQNTAALDQIWQLLSRKLSQNTRK